MSDPYRYEELLRWAEADLSSQGLDEEAVSQALLALTEAVELEDERKEEGGGEVKEANGVKEEEPGGGAGTQLRGLRAEPEVEPETKKNCRWS